MTPRKKKGRIIVKGYMRPDGTSYYVVIPKPVRELLGLKGGEYFLMKAEADDREIELKLVDFAEDTTTIEDSPETTEMTEIKKETSQPEAEERPQEYEPNSLEEDEEELQERTIEPFTEPAGREDVINKTT